MSDNKREFIFNAMTMKWDNIYSCYYGVSLFESKDYKECEEFCFNYHTTYLHNS